MFLAVFDFDNTMIDHRMDINICVQPLLYPDGKLSPELDSILREYGWDYFVRETFRTLHVQGVPKQDIIDRFRSLKLVNGIKELFMEIKSLGGEIIIISDCFTINVEETLNQHGITVDAIYANPSHFTEDDELIIDSPETNSWWKGSCEISGRVMCKGDIMEDYVRHRNFDFIMFAGDGSNDLCAVQRLKYGDLAFPRIDFPLENILEKMKSGLEPSVHPWVSGHDIINVLRNKTTTTPTTKIILPLTTKTNGCGSEERIKSSTSEEITTR